MKNKLCKECNEPIGPTSKSMLCKKCYSKHYMLTYNKNYYQNNSEKIKENVKKWRENNLEHCLQKAKENRERINFDSKREKILKRDNYTCQKCGKYFGPENSSQLIVHHKDGQGRNKNIKNNDDNNLTTECRACHILEHRKEMRKILHEKDMNRWSRKYDKCIECGTTSIGHQAKGLCKNCYARMLTRTKNKTDEDIVQSHSNS